MMPRRLLIVHHKNAGDGPTAPYLINLMRPVWERAGWIVTDVVGVSRKIPADAAILHVDLSLVPDEYREFVESYPVAINGKILDIRKNSTSRNRVVRGDAYDGPVIVKTVLNSAGLPEIKLQFQHRSPFGLAARFLARKGIRWPGGVQPHYPYPMRGKHDYLIFDSARDLPDDVFDCPDLIVEKFLPEIHDGRYCLREWYFFGDVSINLAELSADPVSTFGEQAPQLHRPVPPELWELRRSLGLDYGKIDYAICDGKPVAFDINKTVGTRRPPTEAGKALAASLAEGLESFVKNGAMR
jgi:hypothetical protein